MAPVPRPVFGALLAGLSREAFVAFVADVWRARGYHVTRDGDLLSVSGSRAEPAADHLGDSSTDADDAPVETIYPVPFRFRERLGFTGEPAPSETTTVVLASTRVPSWVREREHLDVVDAEALYDLVLYGLDRERTGSLFREHFDWDPVSDGDARLSIGLRGVIAWYLIKGGRKPMGRRRSGRGGGSRGGGSRGGGSRGGDGTAERDTLLGGVGRGGWPGGTENAGGGDGGSDDPLGVMAPGTGLRVVAVVSVVVLVVASVVLAAGIPALFGSVESGVRESPTPATPTVSATPSFAEASSNPYPRGLSESGVTDPDALVAGHLQAVSERSYWMVLSYREVGPNHTGFAQERIFRETKSHYVSEIQRGGTLQLGAWPISPMEAFANSERRFERYTRGENVTYRAQPVYAGRIGLVERRGVDVIDRAFAAESITLEGSFERGGETFYRLVLAGDQLDRYENVTGMAVVSRRGVIEFLRWQYTDPETGISVAVTVSYEAIGSTTVTEPDWFPAAYNATLADDENESRSP